MTPSSTTARKLVRAILAIFSMISIGTFAGACNIPVFRYALERWTPDRSEIIVLHQDRLSAKHEAVVKQWESKTIAEGGHANANVIRVDLSKDHDTEYAALARDNLPTQSKSVSKIPHIVVRTKVGQGEWVNHWHGSMDAAEKLDFFDSPARKEIGRRLLAGHSIVWILIASSDPDRTKAARAATEKHFADLSQKIKLPEGIGLPGSELYADVPLVVKFSLIEISADDPQEAGISGLFTGFRRDAFDSGEPLLVPVFGRGRALEVIPAGEMTAHLMEDLTVFLSGACSCQVKERNPGFDLPMNVDWNGELFGDEENRPPDRSAEEGRNRGPRLLEIPRGRK